MRDTRKLSKEKEEKGIVGKRKCPRCKETMYYTDNWYLSDSIKKNRKCVKCKDMRTTTARLYGEDNPNWKGSSDPENWVRECPVCDSTITYDNYESFRKAKYKNYGCGCVKKLPFSPGFNINACEIFDKINETFGWNGVHALNGGEHKVLSYFVDYYEPKLNLVIEYDEKYHKYHKEKDIVRQEKIVEQLKCDFIRVQEGEDWEDILKKITNNTKVFK